MHTGHFTVISLAVKVTTLYSVLPVCQGGPNGLMPSLSKASPFLKWRQQCSPSNSHHTEKVWKRRFHDEAMLPMDLHTQKPFGHSTWQKKWLNARVCLHSLGWAPSNHVAYLRCIWWSWEWTRVVGSRTPRRACKQNLLPRNVIRNLVSSHTFVGFSVVGKLGWW